MGRWRSKLLFGLILYFGGFATAIYYLSPVSQDAENRAERRLSLKWPGQAVDTEKCKAAAGKFQDKMENVIAFAEEQAKRAAELYRSQLAKAEKTCGE
jgi:hypothetical protein